MAEQEHKEKKDNTGYIVVRHSDEERKALYRVTREKLHDLFPPSASSSIADAIAEKIEGRPEE